MILYSINNCVELFFLTKTNADLIYKDKLKAIFLIPAHIAEECKLYLPDNSEIIKCPPLYLSKNPFKMLLMVFKFLRVVNKFEKNTIDEVVTVGEVTGNSLILQSIFKLTIVKVFSLQKQTNPRNLKVCLASTFSLSLAYFIFLRKIAFVHTLKTFSKVKVFPSPLRAQLLDYKDMKSNHHESCEQIIVIGERFYPDQSSFSIEEEARYVEFLQNISNHSNKALIKIRLVYFSRSGYTDRYHSTLENMGFNIIETHKSFESYLMNSINKTSGTVVLAVKSTCLVSSALLNLRAYQIGQLIQLEPLNQFNISNFYDGFKNLYLPQLKSISQIF